MLTRLQPTNDFSPAQVNITQAPFPTPFAGGLEFGCAARGTWNIVHTGFLIPEAHEIFVCAGSCLRGVVLTAAEMGASERFSTIEIRENDVYTGDMEELIIDGVTDILHGLPYQPRAVLLYTSCIHHFIGADLPLCYDRLRERFPEIDFVDCYMNPIMRKSGLTPEQLMRRQLYAPLKQCAKQPHQINIIGNNIPASRDCELYTMAEAAGYTVREIHAYTTYSDYLGMAAAMANICYQPVARAAGADLQRRLDQTLLWMPTSFCFEEIVQTLTQYAHFLGVPASDFTEEIAQCEQALEQCKLFLQDSAITIDYTAVLRPLSLARLLISHGFHVTKIYADSFSDEEASDFAWLQAHAPALQICATIHPMMRVIPRNAPTERILAIGQKAAYFENTPYFVNIVENGGCYGFTGILQLLQWMRDAAAAPKDTRNIIQIKGWGCGKQ